MVKELVNGARVLASTQIVRALMNAVQCNVSTRVAE